MKNVSLQSENDVVLRTAVPGDIPQIMSMINSRWQPHKSHSFFQWLLFDAVVPVVVAVCFDEKKIVGMFILHVRKLSNGANCGVACGMVIDNAWRGKGLFSKVANMSTESFPDIDILTSIPNVTGKEALVKSLGFTSIGKIATLNQNSFDGLDYRGISCRAIDEDTVFDKIMQNSDNPVMFAYDQAYYRWRYSLHRSNSFFMVCSDSGEYVVVKMFENPKTGVRYGDIVDFECSLDDVEKLRNLISGACWNLKQQGAETITIWGTSAGNIYKVASEMGFVQDDQNRLFCVKVLNSQYDYLYDFEKWHLVQSDVLYT